MEDAKYLRTVRLGRSPVKGNMTIISLGMVDASGNQYFTSFAARTNFEDAVMKMFYHLNPCGDSSLPAKTVTVNTDGVEQTDES